MDISSGHFAYVKGTLLSTLKPGEATAYPTYNVYSILGSEQYGYHMQLDGHIRFFSSLGVEVSSSQYERHVFPYWNCAPVSCIAISVKRVGMFESPNYSNATRVFYEHYGIPTSRGVVTGVDGSLDLVTAKLDVTDVEKLSLTKRRVLFLKWLRKHGLDIDTRKNAPIPPEFPTMLDIKEMTSTDFVNRLNRLEKTLTKETL